MQLDQDSVVLLIGHGRTASDTPAHLVNEYALARAVRDREPIRFENATKQLREWPRDGINDPYREGLKRIAGVLQHELDGTRVAVAYNEFCGPSIGEAITALVEEGVSSVIVMTTMITPGGNHAERDIPEALKELELVFPDLNIHYVWPFPLAAIGKFLAESVKYALT